MVGRICLAFVLVGCGDDGGAGDDTVGATTMPDVTSSTSSGPTAGSGEDSSGSEAEADSGGESEGSSSTGEPLPDVDFEADIQPIFNNNCTCHLQGSSGKMTAPYLTLNPGMAHGELVGVTAMQVALSRVAAGDLEGSYLWHKLGDTHEAQGGEGDRMPPTVALSDEDLILIRAWIVQGANP